MDGSRAMGSRRSRAVLWCAAAATLALGVAALGRATADMPALSPALRVELPRLGWRPADGFGLYNRGTYLIERAAASLGRATDADDGLRRGLAFALDAVRAAPADAYAWTLLATAAAANGVDDLAREALARSRALAPHTPGVSVERLRLADRDGDREGLARDLALARAGRADELKAVLADPELGPLLAPALSD